KYGMTTSKTKEELQRQLKEFSLDTEQWKLIKPGRRQSHKGPQESANPGGKKALTGSYKRRQELITSTQGGNSGRTTTAVKPKGRLLAWAKEFLAKYPTQPYPTSSKPHDAVPQPTGHTKIMMEKIDSLQLAVDVLREGQHTSGMSGTTTSDCLEVLGSTSMHTEPASTLSAPPALPLSVDNVTLPPFPRRAATPSLPPDPF
ncbi:hypothetical protein V5O48_019359, partial [Marasmius crinis-equi]